jgi:hypothetical protein
MEEVIERLGNLVVRTPALKVWLTITFAVAMGSPATICRIVDLFHEILEYFALLGESHKMWEGPVWSDLLVNNCWSIDFSHVGAGW